MRKFFALYLGCLWGAPLTLYFQLGMPLGEMTLWATMPLLALTGLCLTFTPTDLKRLLTGIGGALLLAPLVLGAVCLWRGGGLYLALAILASLPFAPRHQEQGSP